MHRPLIAASDVYQAESVTSSSESDNTAAIIGGVVAVVFIVTAALTTVVVVILLLRSRGQHYSTCLGNYKMYCTDNWLMFQQLLTRQWRSPSSEATYV